MSAGSPAVGRGRRYGGSSSSLQAGSLPRRDGTEPTGGGRTSGNHAPTWGYLDAVNGEERERESVCVCTVYRKQELNFKVTTFAVQD